MLLVYIGAGLWLASFAGILGLIAKAAKKPTTPPPDPAFRDDPLEAMFKLPAFDPREMA